MRCQLALFSAYRIDQYGDPEGFKTSMGAVLEQYPNDVIVYVCDPRTGVQRSCKFPPTISEIVQACDARVADLKRQERFANWGKSADVELLEAPRESRPSYDQLKAKYGDDWGIKGADDRPAGRVFKAPTKGELAAHYSEYGLAFAPKNMDAAE